MSKKTIILASAAAIGLSGLAWKVIETAIKALQNKALNHEIVAEEAGDPLDRIRNEELGKKFTDKANLLDKFQSINPWTYALHLSRLYKQYIPGRYKGAEY